MLDLHLREMETVVLQRMKQEIEEKVAGKGCIILSDSGTETVIRAMAEAATDNILQENSVMNV